MQTEDRKNYKELYEMLCRELNDQVNEAQALYDDMKKNGLQFSTIEAEGYLRGAIKAKNHIEWVESISRLDI